MNNQLEEIRLLKGRGMSIRDIAGKLSISKYEVEKALLQLKSLPERPDTDSDSCLDEEPDIWPDSQTQSPGQVYLTAAGSKSSKDLPSEWHSGVTRFEADFIITNYIEKYTPLEIKGLYEDEYPTGYISLNDIRKVIQAYEQEETQQSSAKLAAKAATDEQLLRQFINFVGEDALAFLLWVNDTDDWEEDEMERCLTRATALLSDIESFCQTHKLPYRQYEPYGVMIAIKNAMKMGLRKRDEPELDDKAFSFLEILPHKPSLDRYFWKMLGS